MQNRQIGERRKEIDEAIAACEIIREGGEKKDHRRLVFVHIRIGDFSFFQRMTHRIIEVGVPIADLLSLVRNPPDQFGKAYRERCRR